MTHPSHLALAALALAIACSPARAEQSVEISLTNGSVVVCPFSSKPVIALNDGKATLTSTDQNATWLVTDIDCWRFVETDGVDAPDSPGLASISIHSGLITVNAAPGQTVSLCNPGGMVLKSLTVGPDGVASVPTQTLPQGVTIVAVAGTYVKFIKR